MEVNKEVYIEQENIGSSFKEITSSIRAEDLGMALDAVSRNLYSNPIGSFVRELVSNGVDANRKNEISELVKVHIFKEESSWYFQVTDEGKGMTPEVFESVYMKWFNSDKRDNNEDIGGWGIGSKSPLAYAESYEVTTIAEGIQYDYVIVRQSPAPTATLLNEKPTKKKSGTTVRVELNFDDLWEVHKECQAQLVYFNNVVVINDYYYYDNDFKILETDDYKARTSNFPYGEEMHIVIGQVAYPINWNILGIPAIHCPVAVKFEIGELPVTLSREEINYNKEWVKDRILQKIEQTYVKLEAKFYEDFRTTDIIEFVNLWKSDKKTIKLGAYELPFKLRNNKRVSPIFVFQNREFKIQKQVIGDLFMIFRGTSLDKGKTGTLNQYYVNLNLLITSDNAFNQGYLWSSKEDNHWSNLYYNNGVIIRRRKASYTRVKDYAAFLGLTFTTVRNGTIKENVEIGGIKIALNFIKYLERTLKRNLRHYDSVPQSFIDNEKRKQKELEQERKGNISYYDILNARTTVNFESLLKDYDYVFYADKEKDAPADIAAYWCLMNNLSNNHGNKIKFILVSSTTIKKIKKVKDQVHHVSRVFLLKRLFHHFSLLKYANRYSTIGGTPKYLNSISKHYVKVHQPLYKRAKLDVIYSCRIRCNRDSIHADSVYGHTFTFNIYEYFKASIDAVAKPIYELEEAITELEKVNHHLVYIGNIISTSNSNEETIRNIKIKQYVKFHKLLKLKSKYYGNI